MRMIRGFCVMMTVLVIAGCDSTEDETPDGYTPGWTGGLFTYRYTQDGGGLLLAGDTAVCIGQNIMIDSVNKDARVVQNGDSLSLVIADTLQSGAVIDHTFSCVRDDTTGGLDGRWTVTAYQAAIGGAALSAGDALRLARDTAITDSMIAQAGLAVTFRDGLLLGDFTGSLARVLLPVVMGAVPAYVHIDMDTASDGRSVTVAGAFTHETVTINFDWSLNCQFTCSPAGRIPYTDWREPEACDNLTRWFPDFLDDNVSFAEKFTSEDIAGLEQTIDVTIATPDDSTVVITGNQSGEVVTVTCGSAGVVTYTSSVVSHQTHATSSQVVEPPAWWGIFCNENVIL